MADYSSKLKGTLKPIKPVSSFKISKNAKSRQMPKPSYHNKWYVPFDLRFKEEESLSKTEKQLRLERYRLSNIAAKVHFVDHNESSR